MFKYQYILSNDKFIFNPFLIIYDKSGLSQYNMHFNRIAFQVRYLNPILIINT
jgi:hypothetical protein